MPKSLIEAVGGQQPTNPLVAAVGGQQPQELQPQLPYGAVSFTPKGEPYYGAGLKGMVRKFFARFTRPELSQHPDLPSGYETGQYDVANLTPEEQRAVAAQEDVEGFANTAFKTWADFATRFGLTLPEQGQLGGTYEDEFKNFVKSNYAKFRSPISVGIPSGMSQLNTVLWDAVVPILSAGEVPFRKGFAASMGLNELAPGTPLERALGLNKVKFVADKVLSGEPLFTTEERSTMDKYLRGSNMVYTMLVDEAARTDYLRRVESGENPDFVVEDLGNPWVELGGSLVFDVLNAIPGAPSKAARIGSWADEYTKAMKIVGKDADAIIKALAASDDIRAAEHLDDAFKALFKARDDVGKLITSGKFDFRWTAPAASAKQAFLARRINTVLENVMRYGDDVGEIVSDMVKAASKDPDTAKVGFSYLLSSKFGEQFVSPAGMTTIKMLGNLADEVGGTDKLLKTLGKLKTPEETAKFLIGAMDNVVQKMYPSVAEMEKAARAMKAAQLAGKSVDEATAVLAKAYEVVEKQHKWAKWAARAEQKLGKPYRLVNTFFAYSYFGASPGYVVRNVLTDSLATAFSLGAPAGVENLARQLGDAFLSTAKKIAPDQVNLFTEKSVDSIRKILGSNDLPDTVLRGKALHNAMDILRGKGGRLALGAAETTELRSSVFIWEKSLKKTVRGALKSGIKSGELADVRKLEEAGIHADTFLRILFENYGDTKRTIKAYQEAVGKGTVRVIDNIPLPKTAKAFLENLGLDTELEDLIKTAKTKDEVPEIIGRFLDDKISKLDEIAKNTKIVGVDDVVRSSFPEEYKIAQEVIEDGLLEKGSDIIFDGKLQAMRNVEDYSNSFIKYALDSINERLGIDVSKYWSENASFTQYLSTWRQRNDDFRNIVRNGVDELKRLKDKASEEDILSVWNKIVAPDGSKIGDMPPGISWADAKSSIWEFYLVKSRGHWAEFGNANAVNSFSVVKRAAEELNLPPEFANELLNSDFSRKLISATQEHDAWSRVESLADMNIQFGEVIKKFLSQVPPETPLTKAPLNWAMFSDLGFSGGPRRVVAGLNKRAVQAATDGVTPTKLRAGDVTVGQATEYILSKVQATHPIPQEAPMVASQQIKRQLGGLTADLEKWGDELAQRFDETETIVTDQRVMDALNQWAKSANPKITEMRIKAQAIAAGERDWILHSYTDQTYLDQALNYIMPWHYWYSRSYPKYVRRMAENPQVLLSYLKYRRSLEQMHAGLPDWWKYNLSTEDFGIESDNPFYFNLEATLNPMYGLTGVDFYDTRKRVNWYSRLTDDMSKFGPSLFTPINWLVAGALHLQGEEEASKRWMGRLFPITATTKGLLYKMGVNSPVGKYNELDPFINIFHGGLDPYERRRVGRMLGDMVDEGIVTAEAAQEAAHLQSGEVWDAAVERTMSYYAPGQASSFLLGTGFKSRTKTDIEVDNFYKAYYALIDNKGNLSPEQYSDALVKLRGQYPWMDTILLSRQNVEDRDTSYAYSVLSRIPPGQKNDLAELAGVSSDLLSEFYDTKGDFAKMTPADRDRFMAGIADLGALLAIPDDVTASEWIDASYAYKQMKTDMEAQFGENISDLIDSFYNLENQQERDKFMRAHPEVEQALYFQTQTIASTTLLYKYYGGMKVLESYYRTKMYDLLYEKYGDDIQEKFDYWSDLRLTDPGQARIYWRAHPELSGYLDTKAGLQDKVNRIIVDLASKLPDTPQVPTRTDFAPQGATQTQLAGAVNQPNMAWTDWQAVLSEPMQRLIYAYFASGEDLPSAADSELDYLAEVYGYSSGDALLRAIGVSLSASR